MKFVRQDGHKKSKLKRSSWRRPRGLQNKMRLQKKGYRKLPKVGMGTPNVDKNKINGKELFRVSSVKDLAEAKGKMVILAAVGMKKKITIIEEGLKQNIEFSFDAKKVLDDFKKQLADRKKASDDYKKDREAKQAKKAKEEKKDEKKESKAEEETGEEGAKDDESLRKKKDLDKELIHRK